MKRSTSRILAMTLSLFVMVSMTAGMLTAVSLLGRAAYSSYAYDTYENVPASNVLQLVGAEEIKNC